MRDTYSNMFASSIDNTVVAYGFSDDESDAPLDVEVEQPVVVEDAKMTTAPPQRKKRCSPPSTATIPVVMDENPMQPYYGPVRRPIDYDLLVTNVLLVVLVYAASQYLLFRPGISR